MRLETLYYRMPEKLQLLIPRFVREIYKEYGSYYDCGEALNNIYASQVLPSPKISILIVGARYGPYQHLEKLRNIKVVNIVGIEPDPDECERLKKSWPDHTFHQIALGDKTGTEDLYITEHEGKSSIYKPNFNILNKWGYDTSNYKIKDSHEIEVTKLDKFSKEQHYTFDLIQMDAQGSEGDIIIGGKETIKKALCVNLEQNIIERYEGIMTFWEIHDLLNDLGFELVKSSNYDVSDVDTYYLKKNRTDSEEVFKCIIIALLIDYPKLAHSILHSSKEEISINEFNEFDRIIESVLCS